MIPEKYACLFIDATWKDIIAAFSFSTVNNSSQERNLLQGKLEKLFGGSDQWLACLSIRTALDTFLTVMNFPTGSEVIFTAINIPDMVSVVERHGLKIVPVDLDLDTLAPKPELVELAVTDKTVAILAAHLYGKWINLDKVFQVAHSRGLYVLEDCAESFQGLEKKGHKLSDLTFFSFGSIKHYTSLGGAMVRVKNSEILSKMRAKLKEYPVQNQWTYFKKLSCYSLLMASGLNNSLFNWFFINLFHLMGFKYKEYFISLLRAFPGGVSMDKLRSQPSAMLLEFMLYRLRRVNSKDFRMIKLKGDFVSSNLPGNVFVPGQRADIKSYWLFPMLVDDPDEVVTALEKEGVEAYRGATQLSTVYRTKPTEADQKDRAKFRQENQTEKLLYSFSTAQPEVAAGSGSSIGNAVCRPSVEFFCTAPVNTATTNCTFSKEKDDVLFPHNAKYLIDHVVYLPVHKRVSFQHLEHICNSVEKVMKNRIGVKIANTSDVLFKSKL